MSEPLRIWLKREAERSGVALSQVVEDRLWQTRTTDKVGTPWGYEANFLLGNAVLYLARLVDNRTGAEWRKNAFAFETLRIAIDAVLQEFAPPGWAPDGPYDIPEAVEKSAAEVARVARSHPDLAAPELAELHRKPAGLAVSIAAGFVSQLRLHEKQAPFDQRGKHYANEYYLYPKIRGLLAKA